MARRESRGMAVAIAGVALLALSVPSSTQAGAVVFANGRDITQKGSGGTSIGFPDVTYVPCEPYCVGNVPIPFPSIGDSGGTKTYQSKIPTKKKDESAKLGIPYEVFLPAEELGLVKIYLADPITGESFGPGYELLLTETVTGVFIVDVTELDVQSLDIVVELSLASGVSDPETRMLIPFFEGVGVTSVPEPSVLLLLASGLLGLAGYRARAA